MCLALPYAIHQIFLPLEKHAFYTFFSLFFLTLQEFEDDYTNFKAKTLDLDRCVASVLCVEFHDCSSLESVLKVSTHIYETVSLLLGKQFCALNYSFT